MFFQVGQVSLKQVEKFKYLEIAFMVSKAKNCNGKQGEELDVQSYKASALIGALHHSVVLKHKLTKKAKTLNG